MAAFVGKLTLRSFLAVIITMAIPEYASAQMRYPLASPPVSLALPAESTIPAGAEGDSVRLGRAIFTETKRRLPKNVGNGLACSSCHLGAGAVAYASPLIGLWGLYPLYGSRSGKDISLQDRINGCFQRSMNGKALDEHSRAMRALVAYVHWASLGQPAGRSIAGRGYGAIDSKLNPNAEHGAAIYAARCSACHGPDGAGRRGDDGTYQFPPLWGEDSFNVGAGMARTYVAAAFVRYNMPQGDVGSLSDQDAVDVAQFFTHQPRPDYAPRHHDWPKGDAPRDARLE